ncbi:MAG: hypothetical protein SGARI_000078 [Bacillariaceae sp.]
MRQLQLEEHGRKYDEGQHIKWTGGNIVSPDATYPRVHEGEPLGAVAMTPELLQLGLLRFAHMENKQLLVRGVPPPAPVDTDGDAGMDFDLSLSATVQDMLKADLDALQKAQAASVAKTKKKSEYGGHCLDIVKQTLKLTEDSPAQRKEYIEYLESALSKFTLSAAKATAVASSQELLEGEDVYPGKVHS